MAPSAVLSIITSLRNKTLNIILLWKGCVYLEFLQYKNLIFLSFSRDFNLFKSGIILNNFIWDLQRKKLRVEDPFLT